MNKGKSPAPSPKLILSLIEGLPDTSAIAAMAGGGMKHLGWGHDRYLNAAIFDAINSNTIATGQWKKGKAPKLKPWPRPKVKKQQQAEKKPVKVADFYKQFMGAHKL